MPPWANACLLAAAFVVCLGMPGVVSASSGGIPVFWPLEAELRVELVEETESVPPTYTLRFRFPWPTSPWPLSHLELTHRGQLRGQALPGQEELLLPYLVDPTGDWELQPMAGHGQPRGEALALRLDRAALQRLREARRPAQHEPARDPLHASGQPEGVGDEDGLPFDRRVSDSPSTTLDLPSPEDPALLGRAAFGAARAPSDAATGETLQVRWDEAALRGGSPPELEELEAWLTSWWPVLERCFRYHAAGADMDLVLVLGRPSHGPPELLVTLRAERAGARSLGYRDREALLGCVEAQRERLERLDAGWGWEAELLLEWGPSR